MNTIPTKKLVLRISLRLLLILAVLLGLALIVPPLLDLFLPFILAFIAATILAPLVQKFAKRVGGWNFWSMLFVVLMLGLLDGPLSWLQLVFGTGVGALFGEPHMFSFSALFS